MPVRDRDGVGLKAKELLKYKELPACAEGVLNISGAYKVTSKRSFEGCLAVHGFKAVVHLLAPITFSGNTTFTGHIVVEGGGDLESACLVVKGVATLRGQLEFKNCINSAEGKKNDEAGKGGALRAEHVKLQGRVKFEGCKGRLGGAIYAETINVQDSMIAASECKATEKGGVLHSAKGITVQNSSLSATGCSAEAALPLGAGGVIHSEQGVVLKTSSLTATSCFAVYGGGGVIHSEQIVVLDASSLTATNCTAKDGGVICGKKQVVLDTSSLTATNCTARSLGGVISGWEQVVLNTSSLTATSCSAADAGGVIASEWELELDSSMIAASECKANEAGGVLYSLGRVGIQNSSLTASHCSAEKGGVISGVEQVVLDTSMITASECHAEATGGVLHSRCVTIQNSSLTAASCFALEGGVIHSEKDDVVLDASSLTATDCTAAGSGGVIYSNKSVVVDASSLAATSCLAAMFGGVIYSSQNLVMAASSLTATGCFAAQGGGVLIALRDVMLNTSTLTATRCRAKARGGGVISCRELVLGTSALAATNCSAGSMGGIACNAEGVIYCSTHLVLDTSRLSAEGCEAQMDGGALYALTMTALGSSVRAIACKSGGDGGWLAAKSGLGFESKIALKGSDMFVRGSTAGRNGGAAYVDGSMTMAQSRVDIGNCSAVESGGGLWVFHLIGEALNMSNCSAAAMSGCISAKRSLSLDEAVLAGCAASTGNAVASTGRVQIRNLSLLGAATKQSPNYVSVGGPGSSLRLGTMACDDADECAVSSQEAAPLVERVARCPLGTGKDETPLSVGCITCSPGNMLLQPEPDAACVPCPELAEECRPSRMRLRQGITVNASGNFSQALHCPNPAACPAQVIETPVPPIPPSYCQQGYQGAACSSCSSGYGRSDGSVLVCVECSTSTQQLVRHAALYALKDVVLFVIAALGVLGAKAGKKSSSVYLNQLLAFATVSSTALMGVMQTSAFASLRTWAKHLLESIEIFTDISQGQGGATMSIECLLAFARKGLVFAHAASLLMPILLMLTLAMIKDPRLSMVVGTNVFLPGFTAKFGKYLVAYRLQPQDQGGDLLTPFLPDVPGAFWLVLVCIVACFVLGAWSWMHMALSREDPSPPHVLYLTQAYKPNCAAWEVERLVRKMMLTLASTVLPVTLSPALQMQFISAILLGSMMLYQYRLPYKEDDWNRLELGLLGCAVLITGFTTCLLANDSHWSRSMETQFALMVFIAAPAAIVCATLVVLVAVEMYRERARQKEAAALEAEKASEN
ncbi:unnamed protein product [Effrenium voratum]|nr:unnamed protein product [Effrenium voratum]